MLLHRKPHWKVDIIWSKRFLYSPRCSPIPKHEFQIYLCIAVHIFELTCLTNASSLDMGIFAPADDFVPPPLPTHCLETSWKINPRLDTSPLPGVFLAEILNCPLSVAVFTIRTL